MKTYQGGEELFALRITDYPELNKTRKELNLLDQLYGLYMDVVNTMDEYRNMCMTELIERMEEMTGKVTEFDVRCSKMPRKLRDWEAYTALRTDITDFQDMLPLLQELAKPSIKPRHWTQIKTITHAEKMPTDLDLLKLHMLWDCKMLTYKEEIEEITEMGTESGGIS